MIELISVWLGARTFCRLFRVIIMQQNLCFRRRGRWCIVLIWRRQNGRGFWRGGGQLSVTWHHVEWQSGIQWCTWCIWHHKTWRAWWLVCKNNTKSFLEHRMGTTRWGINSSMVISVSSLIKYIFVILSIIATCHLFWPDSDPGGSTPLYGLDRYVPPDRVMVF